MTIVDVWITCPDVETARAIATAVIEERLAACANLYPGIESLYRWEGAIERAAEVTLILKTRASLIESVTARAIALHPYTLPAIHAVTAVGVTGAYRAWVETETAAPA